MNSITESQMSHVPSGTATHRPISHNVVATTVFNAILNSGAGEIMHESVDVSKDGERAVGTFRLQGNPDAPFTTTIGWINSHDKTSSVKLLFGSHVFVCSNGCVVGEKILARKHTSKIMENLPLLTISAITDNLDLLKAETLRLESYRSTMLSATQVSHVLVKAVEAGVIPAKDILKVQEEYNTPTFEAHHHNGGDAFRLLNAFTEHQKRYNPLARIKRSQLLMPVLDMVV